VGQLRRRNIHHADELQLYRSGMDVAHQRPGLAPVLEDGSRGCCSASRHRTQGAILRSTWSATWARRQLDRIQQALADLISAADQLAEIAAVVWTSPQ